MALQVMEFQVQEYKISMTFTPPKNVQGNFNIDGKLSEHVTF